MLRTLVLKNVLGYVCVALSVALALVALRGFAGLGRASGPIEGDGISVEKPQIAVATVGKRKDYNIISDSEIFGKDVAAAPKKPAQPKKPKKPEPKKEVASTLPLKLIGTVVSGDDDPSGSAIIENRSGAVDKKTYFVGDQVMDEIFVQSIRRRAVVLDNQRANRLETLELVEAEPSFRPVARRVASDIRSRLSSANRPQPAARERNPAAQRANRIFTFKRDEVVRELEEKYDSMASNVDVRVVKDADGNVQGIQASNLASTPMASKFGFQEGDIVTRVNGQRVDSMDRVTDIVDKNRNATTFRVELLRSGRPVTFTYHFR